MRRISYLFAGLIVLLSAVFVIQTQQVSAESNADYVKGEVLVKFVEGTNQNDIANTHKRYGGKVKSIIPGVNVQVVDIGNKNVGQAVSAYARSGYIEFVEPNYIAKALTSDTRFDRQWGLNNVGQQTCNATGDICTTGSDDADVDAPEAWNMTTGDSTVKIAILDSGIDQDHPDLINKVVASADFTGSGFEDNYGHGRTLLV